MKACSSLHAAIFVCFGEKNASFGSEINRLGFRCKMSPRSARFNLRCQPASPGGVRVFQVGAFGDGVGGVRSWGEGQGPGWGSGEVSEVVEKMTGSTQSLTRTGSSTAGCAYTTITFASKSTKTCAFATTTITTSSAMPLISS